MAHAFGLDHEFLCADPMTYLSDCGSSKTFQNAEARCGEYEARDCECSRPSQNSYKKMMSVFGPRAATPPQVGITEPHPGDTVPPWFVVRADISGNVGLYSVELRINGVTVLARKDPPFEFRAPLELPMGPQSVEVRATDVFGAVGLADVNVVQQSACDAATDCASGEECVVGRCVAGSTLEGGLGRNCSAPSDCSSGLCYADGDGDGRSLCTEPCLPDRASCPSGFSCRDAVDLNVCWPGRSGGCAAAAPGSLAWWFLAPLGALLWRRRRRIR
jgi:hypothetical protein